MLTCNLLLDKLDADGSTWYGVQQRRLYTACFTNDALRSAICSASSNEQKGKGETTARKPIDTYVRLFDSRETLQCRDVIVDGENAYTPVCRVLVREIAGKFQR
jgi:hypothetical protein